MILPSTLIACDRGKLTINLSRNTIVVNHTSNNCHVRRRPATPKIVVHLWRRGTNVRLDHLPLTGPPRQVSHGAQAQQLHSTARIPSKS